MILTEFLLRGTLIRASVVVLVFGVAYSIRPNYALAQEPGKWLISAKFDEYQYLDASVPVIVVRVVSGPENKEEGKNTLVIKEAIVENRTTKNVESVVLRWVITPMKDETPVLFRGEMAPHKLIDLSKTLIAGHRQTLKLSVPKIAALLNELPNADSYANRFSVLIGVAKVTFEDGSTWEENLSPAKTTGLNKGETKAPLFMKSGLVAQRVETDWKGALKW